MLGHITNATTGLKNWQMNTRVLDQSKATLLVVLSAPSTGIQTLSLMTISPAAAVSLYTHSLALTSHHSTLVFLGIIALSASDIISKTKDTTTTRSCHSHNRNYTTRVGIQFQGLLEHFFRSNHSGN